MGVVLRRGAKRARSETTSKEDQYKSREKDVRHMTSLKEIIDSQPLTSLMYSAVVGFLQSIVTGKLFLAITEDKARAKFPLPNTVILTGNGKG
jgi:hypothetical protein